MHKMIGAVAAGAVAALLATWLTAAAASAATPTVTLLSHSMWGPDAAGYDHIVGEVQNTGSADAGMVEVNIDLYDSSNRLLDTEFTFAELNTLGPGEKAPFEDTFQPPAGFDHATITSVDPSTAYSQPNHNFTVTVTNTSTQYGMQHIVGQVTNENTTTADNVEVVFTFYNSADHVVDEDYTFVNTGSNSSIPAGNTASFALDRDFGAPAYDHYAAVAESSSPPSPGTSSIPQTRLAGADRDLTAIKVSQDEFPQAGSAGAVVLAANNVFADALAGTPLAYQKHGPLLLTPQASLDGHTADEIRRVLPAGGAVYILGATPSVSQAVQAAVASMGYHVTRIAGQTRFETATKIADALGDPTTVFEASGLDFPDALSAGAAAAHTGGVILLTRGSQQAADTAAYLNAHPGTRFAIGGPAAAADPQATPLAGGNRWETSVMVASRFFGTPKVAGFASGFKFPDALSGGVHQAMKGGPVVLVPGSGNLPGATKNWLATARNSLTAEYIYGGQPSVGSDVASRLK